MPFPISFVGRSRTVVAIFFLSLLISGSANAETWMCRFHKIGMKGWIPKTLELQVDPSTKTGLVHDGNTLASYGKPARVAFEDTAPSSYKFKWVAKNLNVDKSMVINTTHYFAALNKSSGRIHLSVVIGGRDDRPSGHGRCKRSEAMGTFHTPERITRRPITFTPLR